MSTISDIFFDTSMDGNGLVGRHFFKKENKNFGEVEKNKRVEKERENKTNKEREREKKNCSLSFLPEINNVNNFVSQICFRL